MAAVHRTHKHQFLAISAFTFASAMVMLFGVGPYSSPLTTEVAYADSYTGETIKAEVTQSFSFNNDQTITVARGVATAKAAPKVQVATKSATVASNAGSTSTSVSAASAPAPAPGSAKAYAKSKLAAKGLGDGEYSCLVSLWNRESGWRYNASNASGAYGIPQALPGSKMGAFGSDWRTNAETQIDWGLNYIYGRYSTPCGAWASSQSRGWY